jgi:hypothetical protein
MTKTLVYKAEDVFEDIENDEENVLFKIPPEVAEKAGFKPGDTLKIEKHPEGGISITKVKNGEEG